MNIEEILCTIFSHSQTICQIVLSKPIKKANAENTKFEKIKITPQFSQNVQSFFAEQKTQTQVFHQHFDEKRLYVFLQDNIGKTFQTVSIKTTQKLWTFLSNKKGKITILQTAQENSPTPLSSQNRQKNYLLQEGTIIPFLVHLGIMTQEGKIVAQKYDKFRQMNKFLEYVNDILPQIIPETTAEKQVIQIIDFGCGKSYVTFALYYFLTTIRQLSVKITGLDLKKDVIDHCNELANQCKYTNLTFIHHDIADFPFTNQFDLMISLHACNTATDFAIAQAIKNKIPAMLVVPCCHHEINQQLSKAKIDFSLHSLIKHGIIKERFASLVTDLMRAEILESAGYHTQILEFIDITHTPKNLLIRAVKSKNNREKSLNQHKSIELSDDYKNLCTILGVNPTLEKII